MDAATQALCFFYRNPPATSGVKPQPYKAIPDLIGRPHMSGGAIKMAVHRFGSEKQRRGRAKGWHKTTVAQVHSLRADEAPGGSTGFPQCEAQRLPMRFRGVAGSHGPPNLRQRA